MQSPSTRKHLVLVSVLGTVVLLSPVAYACSSCGCLLSSDWENLGISTASGLKLDLRYDYINQDQLRSGTSNISASRASQALSKGNPQEVESYTRNNYFTASVDYNFDRNWAANLQIPYVFRSHDTLGTASNGNIAGAGGEQYRSNTANIGDVKLLGRYQGFTEEHNVGVLFGAKLPTGSHAESGRSTDPTAPGPVILDRGLQPGTGTTDLILGAYYMGAVNADWSYFAQGIVQTALNSNDHFKLGNGINLNAGLRYTGFVLVTPQLQINTRIVERDQGNEADTVSTGGRLLYLSPGAAIQLSQQVSVYGFVQAPLFQDINGVQLTPRYTASVGIHTAF